MIGQVTISDFDNLSISTVSTGTDQGYAISNQGGIVTLSGGSITLNSDNRGALLSLALEGYEGRTTITANELVINSTINGQDADRKKASVYAQDGKIDITVADRFVINTTLGEAQTSPAYALHVDGGEINLDAQGTALVGGDVLVSSGEAQLKAVSSVFNGKLRAENAESKLEVFGDTTVSYANPGAAVDARKGGTIALGREGDTIVVENIVSEDPSSSEQVSMGIAAIANGAVVTVEGDELTVNVAAKGNDWAYGVHAQNNTQPANDAETFATINLNSAKTVINAEAEANGQGQAIGAMSQGIVNVNGDLELNTAYDYDVPTTNAITARGYAQVNINQSLENSVKMKGDIAFDYDAPTSGTTVNASVNVNLSTADSYWTGRSYVSGNPPPELSQVENFRLYLSNGATWNVTGDSFVNELTLKDGGQVLTDNTARLTLDTVNAKGTGNTVQLGSEPADIDLLYVNRGDIAFTTAEGDLGKVNLETMKLILGNASGHFTFVGQDAYLKAESYTDDPMPVITGSVTVAAGSKLEYSDFLGTGLWVNEFHIAEGAELQYNDAVRLDVGSITIAENGAVKYSGQYNVNLNIYGDSVNNGEINLGYTGWNDMPEAHQEPNLQIFNGATLVNKGTIALEQGAINIDNGTLKTKAGDSLRFYELLLRENGTLDIISDESHTSEKFEFVTDDWSSKILHLDGGSLKVDGKEFAGDFTVGGGTSLVVGGGSYDHRSLLVVGLPDEFFEDYGDMAPLMKKFCSSQVLIEENGHYSADSVTLDGGSDLRAQNLGTGKGQLHVGRLQLNELGTMVLSDLDAEDAVLTVADGTTIVYNGGYIASTDPGIGMDEERLYDGAIVLGNGETAGSLEVNSNNYVLVPPETEDGDFALEHQSYKATTVTLGHDDSKLSIGEAGEFVITEALDVKAGTVEAATLGEGAGNITANRITLGGNLKLKELDSLNVAEGAEFTLNGGSILVNGEVFEGAVNNQGTLGINGDYRFGSVDNSSDITVDADKTLTASGLSNTGTVTATDATIRIEGTLVNTGRITADTLEAADGSDAGTTYRNLTVLNAENAQFVLTADRTVETLAVEGALKADAFAVTTADMTNSGTISAKTLKADELANTGSVTAESISAGVLTNTGTVKGGVLSIGTGTSTGTITASELRVEGSGEGELRISATRDQIDSVLVASDGRLTADGSLKADSIDNKGELRAEGDATHLTVTAGVFNNDVSGKFFADALRVSTGFDAGLSEVKTLTVADSGEGRFVLDNAKTFTNVEVADGGRLTTESLLTVTDKLTGTGSLEVGEIAISETTDLSGFTGSAAVSGGSYALDDNSTWFGGDVKMAGASQLDVTGLTDGKPIVEKVTITDNAGLTGRSEQLFTQGLGENAAGTNPEGIRFGAEGGSVTVADSEYNIYYAGSAAELIARESNGNAATVFSGDLVTSAGAGSVDAERTNTLTLAEANAVYGNHAVLGKVTLDASEGTGTALVAGRLEDSMSGDVLITNLGFQNMKLGSSVQDIVINDNRTITLAGALEGDAVKLFEGGAEGLTVTVGTADSNGNLRLGAEGVASKGILNADLNVTEKGFASVEGGSFTSEGSVTNDGSLTVKEGASFITTGNFENNSTAAISGTLGAGVLANTGTIDAASGTVIVTGTLANTGSLTAKHLQVANGTDSGEFNVANLTALATDGEGFNLEGVDSFESVVVNEGGKLTAENLTAKTLTSSGTLNAETLKVGAGSETGEFIVKTLTVEGGEFTLGAARKFETALNINADGKLSSDYDIESKTITVAETGSIETMGLKAQTFANAGAAALGIVETDELTNTGRITAAEVTAKTFTSTGSFTADELKVANGSETGEFNVKTLTVTDGEFTLGASRTFETALNVNAGGTLSSDFDVESKTVTVAETGTIDTMGLKAESFSNAGMASLGIVEADAITNTGSIAAAEVTANTFKSTGSFEADELKVGNGSESGTFDVTKLTVNGNFALGGNRSFNSLNIAEGATLNAEELEVFGNETKLAGAMTADTLAVTTLELTGNLTAGILSVNSGFDDGNTVEVDNLFVNESESGFELRKDREFVVVEVKEDAHLTAGNLTVNDAIVNGTLKANTLNVANGEAGAGLSVKNLIVTGPTVVSEDDEESVFSLTSAQSFESLAVEKTGVLEALDITAGTVSADGSVTAGKLTISGELKGAGSLTLSEVAIGEKASLSGFTGRADLSAGDYKLTDGSTWFGGSVTLRGSALADVTQLSDAEKVLGKLTVDGGSLTALSAQIFNASLGEEGNNADPESVRTEAKLSEGILTLDDKIYNLKYADNAASLLNKDGSSMRLVFTGTLYKEPAPETPPATDNTTNNITVDDIIGGSGGESGSESGSGSGVSSDVIYAGATLDATKNTDSDLPNSNPDNLVIGSVSQVVSDGETKAQEVDKSLGVKNVAVSDKADMVAINNNRTLTLVGGDVDETGSNNLILTGSKDLTLQVGGSQTVGVLELGVKTEGVANHGTINAALNIKAAGKMFVNAGNFVAEQDVNTEGEISISEGANLSAQQNVTVEKGAVVTVDGELSVENKNDTESSAQLTMKTGSTLAVNGKATIDKIELNSADAQDKDHGIITIGNKDKAGTAVIKSLGDNHNKLRIFLDPAWSATDGTIEQASSLVLNTETFDGDLIVGQNSYAVFGSEADRADLLAKFRSAEMTWGEADTTALVYAPGTIDLGTTGRIIVNGAYTTISDADNAPEGKAVYVAPNSVLVANADTSLIKASGRSDFKVLFDEGSTLLLDKVTAQTNVYNIFNGAEVTRTGATVKATNAFFDLAWADDDNGSVTVTLNTANNEYSGLMQGAVLAGSAMSQPDSDEYRYADGILTHYGLDRAGGAAAFDAAMNPMGALATYTTAFDRASELKNAVRDEAGSAQEPRLWVRMTGGKTKLDGISTGTQSLSVKTETFGVIAGGETSAADTVLGAAFAAGTGSTRNNSIGGKDSFSYYGLSAYAQRELGGISFTADLSGTWLKSEMSAGGVIDVSNDADTSVYTFGLEAKKSFDVSGMALTPFIGLDVYRICSDDLTTKHGAKIESAHTTAVEVPIGARAAMDFTTTDGTRVRPNFSLAVVPTFGDRDIDVATRFAGAKSNLNFTFADDVKVRSNLGITAEKKNVRFGLDLGYEWGNEERLATNLMLRANFAF